MSELEPTRTYSNHTATDELRRMLDERGVEWRRTPHYSSESMDNETVFCGIGIEWLAGDHLNGRLGLRALKYEVTPEQAVEATLGRGECRNTAPSYLDFLCSECGFVHYHSDENDSGGGNEWRYCPNCGARVVSDDD